MTVWTVPLIRESDVKNELSKSHWGQEKEHTRQQFKATLGQSPDHIGSGWLTSAFGGKLAKAL